MSASGEQRDDSRITLRAILVLSLRFYALNFAVQAVELVPSFISLFAVSGTFQWVVFMEIASLIFAALIVWVIAERFAKLIARGMDGNIAFDLSFEDACALAFIFLGLRFVLGYAASTILTIYELLALNGFRSPQGDTEAKLVQHVAEHGIGLMFGLASVLGARSWARKLGRFR